MDPLGMFRMCCPKNWTVLCNLGRNPGSDNLQVSQVRVVIHSYNLSIYIYMSTLYTKGSPPTQVPESSPPGLHETSFRIGDPYKPLLSTVSGWGGRSKLVYIITQLFGTSPTLWQDLRPTNAQPTGFI